MSDRQLLSGGPLEREQEFLFRVHQESYFVFAEAFFLRSAQRFFISSESLLRPAAVSRPRLAVRCIEWFPPDGLGRAVESVLARMSRAETSRAISPLIS